MALENLYSTDGKISKEIFDDPTNIYNINNNSSHKTYTTPNLCENLKANDTKKSLAAFEPTPVDYSKNDRLPLSENSPCSTDSEGDFCIESELERQKKSEPRNVKLKNTSERNNNCNYNFFAFKDTPPKLEPKNCDFESEYSKHLISSLISESNSSQKILNIPKISTDDRLISRLDLPTQTEPRTNLILPPKKRIRDPFLYTDVKKQRLHSPELKLKEERNEEIASKYIKPPCKCVYKCYNKIDFSERIKIFQSFSEINDTQKQMDFLLKNTEKFKKVNCNIRNLASTHTFTFKYKLPLVSKDVAIPVCKKMFVNTLLVSDKLIKSAWESFENGKEFVQNNRGRSKKHKKVVVKTMVKSVRDHVNSFTPVDSPYSGENISKLYLDGTLSISRMFHLYNEWIDPNKYIRRAKTERQYKELVKKNLEITYSVSNNNQYNFDSDYNVPKYDTQNVIQNIVDITNDNEKVSTYSNYSPPVPCLTDSKDHFCKEHEQPSTGDNQFDAEMIAEPLNNYSKYHNHSATSAVINCNCIKPYAENTLTTQNPISNAISSLQPLTTLKENMPNSSDVSLPSNVSKVQENFNNSETKNELLPLSKNITMKRKTFLKKRRNILLAKALKRSCICIYKCSDKLSASERKNINQQFQDLGDKNKQSDFILKHTEKVKKKRCVSQNALSSRLCKFTYKLPDSSGTLVKVCKRMFLNTLVISESTIRAAWEKYDEHNKDIVPKGQKINARKIAKSIIKSIRDHINTFVPVEAHFIGRQNEKIYLDGSLNISRLFQLYNVWFDPNKYIRKAKTEKRYRQIIDKHFNLGFHESKRDECDQCQSFRKLAKPNDEQMAQHIIHTQNIVTTHNKKNQDKLEASVSNGKIVTAIFDIEKLLPCPNGQESHFNNKRKLFCYNLPILDMISKRPVCYMWDERFAKNGVNEVGSCLFDFLNSNIANGVREFRFWSENDESRNHVIFCVYVAVAYRNKVDIYHNFHVKDHVQSEIASVHSVIEKVSSTKHIFTPEEWKQLVKWIKTNCQEPYKVIDMTQDDFYNFESHVNNCDWQKDMDGKTVSWNNVREIYISSNDPSKVQFKYDFNQEYGIIELNKQTEFPEILRAYSKMLPLSDAKYNDLISLCNNGFIPKEHIEYYKKLPFAGENLN